MAVYCISYDLNRPGQEYEPLYEAIRSYGTWWHHLDSTWFIQSEQAVKHVYDYLSRYIDKNDQIVIVEVKSVYWGQLSSEAHDWLLTVLISDST